ncbi:uncharacterized protein BKA55DRAFT_694754 [Fusarium redolens]|uniref:2EXR domain-containing protein n=1 Tax=Fusarium redolens TaxID=48865 RepID=A0A9P9GE57_FUSRE|nr:uncharacterized protein BKA55DRAFT_694754 [Fusarium redolens]KAH7237128.1 hypothetical protein BKA55DRAFT_694754 [Fusarium redolens]
MAAFKRFPELPRELRDQIWSMAIRDDRPGVHIFGQYEETKENSSESHALRHGIFISLNWAAPSWRRYFDNLNEDQSDENISTYFIDGGLWTACHESRLIMEKRFQQSNRNLYKCITPKYDREKDIFKKASTGCFDAKIGWSLLALEACMERGDEGFGGVQHIAIEYDPKWWEDISEGPYYPDSPDITALIHAAFELDCFTCKLWFIDRTLKRKKDAPPFKEQKGKSYYSINAFYASDRRFLEIDHNNYSPYEEWDYIRPLRLYPDDDSSSDVDEFGLDYEFSSSPDFVSHLEDKIHHRYHPDDSEEDYYFSIGLLGWDDL